jgi:putative holliday junction resolvase
MAFLADLSPLDILPTQCRLMGLDVGTKTVGVAISDVSRRIASPLITVEHKKFTTTALHLTNLCHTHRIAAVIVGLPLNMDGTEGVRAQSTHSFVRNLEKYFMEQGLLLPFILWDERLSTVAVTRTLLEADVSRARRAEVVDKMAASYILQGVLDSL